MPAKKPKDERKDTIIQTRVNEALDDRLRQEAKQRRLPVSQLIRNLLQDSFALVGNVVDNVDAIAQDAIGLGKQAGADAQHLARRATHKTSKEGEDQERDEDAEDGESGDEAPLSPLADILAWQEVVLNGPQTCSRCDSKLPKGQAGFMGISATPGVVAWLCEDCRQRL